MASRGACPLNLPPPGPPEIALAGRSNAGKSSLLNALCGRRRLAPVSKTPGRTRQIQLYDSGMGFLLADLPGYGFAKAPAAERERWKHILESYFSSGRPIALALSLLDIRHPISPLDEQLHAYFRSQGIPWEPVATKADKLSGIEKKRRLEELRLQLGLTYTPLRFSAVTGEGREALLHHLRACAAGYRGNPRPF